MTSGILLIDKPIGITSFDVIRSLRKRLNIRKMGHAGTLDPFASGLLVVAMGEATKALSEFLLDAKEYEAELHLGATSSTDDPEGEIKNQETESRKQISEQEFKKTLQHFIGKIQQTPPVYSALKVAGKRAADRVRAGEDMGEAIRAKTREVEILELRMTKYEFPKATVHVRCSTGTYIRSLARDIGQELKCGAYLTLLRRTAVGCFRAQDASTLENVTEKDIISLKPEMFPFPSIEVTEEEEQEIRQGRSIPNYELQITNESKVSLFRKNHIVAFATVQDGKIQPRRVFQ
jgi:tRNA pseudouridine55 synthase